jgi:MmyB-like transcription regulator ligand binding domain
MRLRFHHPEVGAPELTNVSLPPSAPAHDKHTLTVYTAEPGSPLEDRLKLLASWAASHNPTSTSS